MATMDVKDAAGATVAVEKPLAPGRTAAATSRPVALSSEDFAVIDNLETLITSTNTKLDTLHTDLGTTLHTDLGTTLAGYLDGVETALAALSQRWAFDVAVVPTVTNGGYTAGDNIGGLLTFSNVARANDELFIVTGAQVISKAAVVPALTLILFNADPTGTSRADNDAYSLAAADAFKPVKSIPISAITDHGTPNSWSNDGLYVVCTPASGTRNIFGLLIDATGVTLTSTSDIQVRLRGTGI